ncbi:four helix bundle protein [Fibrivirga algicola]|uniref:Four helix bundle protein n=1 Tax=Fibrivirga algicola TaxID=2950420 RepID=A0ABX0QK64_9BACT|nr:four helix bundle protein [Fibrivirga algicola]NID12850.1 four helix bundle protein [Fibrivirga algicola]
MTVNSFEELDVYKACRAFRRNMSVLTKRFPTEERYRLTDQLIRSSRSTTANVAEGFGRFHFQENIQFCRQVRGSLTESLEHVLVAHDEGYIDDRLLEQIRIKYIQCLKLLNGYISHLQKQKLSS